MHIYPGIFGGEGGDILLGIKVISPKNATLMVKFSHFTLQVGKCFLNSIAFQTLWYFKSSLLRVGSYLEIFSPHCTGKEAEAERFPNAEH